MKAKFPPFPMKGIPDVVSLDRSALPPEGWILRLGVWGIVSPHRREVSLFTPSEAQIRGASPRRRMPTDQRPRPSHALWQLRHAVGAATVGALGFLGPHLYFLWVRGQRVWLNPPTTLWPTLALIFLGSVLVAYLHPRQVRGAIPAIGAGVVGGNILLMVVRGEFAFFPIALLLAAALSAPSVIGGVWLGALLGRRREPH